MSIPCIKDSMMMIVIVFTLRLSVFSKKCFYASTNRDFSSRAAIKNSASDCLITVFPLKRCVSDVRFFYVD